MICDTTYIVSFPTLRVPANTATDHEVLFGFSSRGVPVSFWPIFQHRCRIGSGAMRANPRLHWKAICNSQITTLLIYARSMTDTVVKKPRNTLWGEVTSQHLDHCHKFLFISPHHLVIGCRTSSHLFFFVEPCRSDSSSPSSSERAFLFFVATVACSMTSLVYE
jgi:hypothetical protein